MHKTEPASVWTHKKFNEYALSWSALGYSVIPLNPYNPRAIIGEGAGMVRADYCKIPAVQILPGGKWKPYTSKRADDLQLLRWWPIDGTPDMPLYNMGICAGEVSGLLVVDWDGTEAGKRFLQELGIWDSVPSVQTGGGGRHFYFRYQKGVRSADYYTEPDANGERIKLFEVKSNGYQVVAPPSIHPNGNPYIADPDDFIVLPDFDANLFQFTEQYYAGRPTIVGYTGTRQTPRRDDGEGHPLSEGGQASSTRLGGQDGGANRPTFDGSHFLRKAIERASSEGRNNIGSWLAQQLRDDRLLYAQAEAVMLQYQAATEHMKSQPYTVSEIHRTLRSAYNSPPREPARNPNALRVASAPAYHGHAHETQTVQTPNASPAPDDDAPKNAPDGAPCPAVDTTIYPQTDTGNGEILVARFGENLRYDHSVEEWYRWDGLAYNHQTDTWLIREGARWRPDDIGLVHLAAKSNARLRYVQAHDITRDTDDDKELDKLRREARKFARLCENDGKANAALSRARYEQPVALTHDVWDSNLNLLGVHNGVIELDSATFRPARREDYLLKQCGTRYDPDADCPRWKQYLREVFPSTPGSAMANDQLIAYVQRAVGYTLTGHVRERKIFFCFGAGSNGKSTFLEVLSALMADYAQEAAFTTFEAQQYQQSNAPTPELFKLVGARFVACREGKEDARLNESRVKMMTGGEKMTARALHNAPVDFMPQFKIWIAFNHKPEIRGTDFGIWSRIELIPFIATFDAAKKDDTLKDKLIAELPGILNWALEGVRQWNANGLATPEAVQESTQDYRSESDIIGRFFEDCVDTTDPRAHVVASTLYMSYVQWAKDNGEKEIMSGTAFGRRIKERGINCIRSKTGRDYYGIRIHGLDSRF